MEIKNLKLESVTPSQMNPRKTFDQEELQELADNIEKQGLLQPITVRLIKDTEKFRVKDGVAGFHPEYEIICGERRYRAMKLLSDRWKEMDIVAPKGATYDRFNTISAIVREMNDEDAFDAMITENLQRKDVDPIEEAFAFGQLIERGKTIDEVAARFGKSRRFVLDRVKLNSLIPELLLAVKEDRMSISAAMIICKLDEAQQTEYFKTYQNYSEYSAITANNYLRDLFMNLAQTPWYQNRGKKFAGGCGRPCTECVNNTNNHGCLFWEMKSNGDGRCTDREMYEKKSVAWVLHVIEKDKDNFVKKDGKLESGKTVIVDDIDSCQPGTQGKIAKATLNAIIDAGYKVIKPSDYFDHECYYSPGDERIKKMLEKGEIYRCFKFRYYNGINPRITYYYHKRGAATGQTPEEARAQSEALELTAKYRRVDEIRNDKLADSLRSLAQEQKTHETISSIGKASLTMDEMVALMALLYDRFEYNSTFKNSVKDEMKDLSSSEMMDYFRKHVAEIPLYIREYIRTRISSGVYGIVREAQTLVMKQWRNEDTAPLIESLDKDARKKHDKLEEKLNALGYTTDGKLIEKDVKRSEVIPTEPDLPELDDVETMRNNHPDAILFFEVNGNYECYNQDAKDVSEVTGLSVMSYKKWGNNEDIVIFPKSKLDTYLPMLVRAKHRVAICEQKKK